MDRPVLSVSLSAGGCSSHFHILAAANSAAGNMRVHVFIEYLFSVFLDI